MGSGDPADGARDPADAGERHERSAPAGGRNVRPLHAGKRYGESADRTPRNVGPVDEGPGKASARLGGAQQGSVRRDQLRAAGVSRHVIDRRVLNGNLYRVHRGVYIVGHLALPPRAMESAALLACGDGALISHRSAAYLWSLLEKPPEQVDVTLVGRRCRPKDGVRIHGVAEIDPRDVRRRGGMLLTAPARTLIDFAAHAGGAELERALAEARVRRLLRDGELEVALGRAGTRAGAGKMRALLRDEGPPTLTRSEGERRMVRLTRAARLPVPVCNSPVAGYSVDFLWPAQRVIVEVDGYVYHGHRAAFERDHRRDMELENAGYHVIRVTWRQTAEEPLAVVAHIARALERRS